MATTSINLENLDGTNGFVVNAQANRVAIIGDINDDGIDDIAVANPNAGETSIIFGVAGGFDASVTPSATNGFSIVAGLPGIQAGYSISAVGDFNGDGIDDFFMGAPQGDPDGRNNAGQSYLIFGSKDGFPDELNLQSLDGTNGFVLNGVTGSGNGRPPDLSGLSVSSADVNGDGLADLLIGSGQKPNVVSNTGSPNLELGGVAYVFFGTSEPMPAAVELSTLDGTNGFTLLGLVPGGGVGASIAGAGDLNGDGKDEILVGAPQGGGNFSTRGPSSYDYIVYGSDQPFDPVVGLAEPGSQTGDVVILTGNQSYQRGDAVSAAGDINNDGFDDLMAGNWPTNNGASVVFGGPNLPSVIDLDQLTGSDGFNIATGENGFGSPWLAEAGDVNDDGIKDFLVGQPEAKGNTGEVYLVFGTEEGFPANLDPSTLDGTNGLILNTGSTDSDSLGVSVSGNGDVNGDGIDDIAIAAFSGQSVYIVYGTDDHSDEVGVTFEGDEANDRFFGESSPDRAFGGPGRDLLFGGDDDDFLFGGPDNDKLFGGKDDDELRGGLGRDLKVGGRGDDTYAGTAEELDGDRIIGFGPGDQIVIDSFDFDVEVEKKWFGSSEISFDTDGNGSLDGSLKVYGVFGRRDFDVEQVGDDTVITLGEPEPFGGFFSSFFERISDGWDFF